MTVQETGREPSGYDDLVQMHRDLRDRHEELVRQMGDEIAPFPSAGIDGFLSHFIMSIEFLKGEAAGKTVSLVLPPAAQTVARSDPFRYSGPDHRVVTGGPVLFA